MADVNRGRKDGKETGDSGYCLLIFFCKPENALKIKYILKREIFRWYFFSFLLDSSGINKCEVNNTNCCYILSNNTSCYVLNFKKPLAHCA